MPVLNVKKEKILHDFNMDSEEFERRLFDFGLEIDGEQEIDGLMHFKVEIPANRFDLLSTSGLYYALSCYFFNMSYKDITVVEGGKRIFYEPVDAKRKFVAAAIIRDIQFTEESYNDFIEFQEQLHHNLGRDRKYISLGTHDNDKISWPISFRHHGNMEFTPLNKEKVRCADLIKLYEGDKKFKKYFSYLDSEYVFVDSNNNLLSYPPIINSEYSKITVATKNILIEVTGSDRFKVDSALKLLLYNFRGKDNTVESVLINDILYPQLSYSKYVLSVEEVNRELDLELTGEQIALYLNCMMHNAKLIDGEIHCMIFDVRQDILHKCDLIEDIAIKFGINNFPNKLPLVRSFGKLTGRTVISSELRTDMISCGYIEVLSMILLNREEMELFGSAIPVLNPNSKECEVIRTSLLPGLLKSIRHNQHLKAPFKIFEVGDVVLPANNDVGFLNNRHIAGVVSGRTDAFEDIQGTISHILRKHNFKYIQGKNKIYLEKRVGAIFVDNVHIGDFGIVDIDIMRELKIPYIVTAFEISINKLIEYFFYAKNKK